MTFYTVGVFDNYRPAQDVVAVLHSAGVTDAAITLLASAEAGEIANIIKTKPEKSAMEGALLGTGIGSALGALGTVALVTIPGLGVVVASGVIAILSGGAIGGYLGALYGTRAETDDVISIKNEISADDIIIVVQADDQAEAKRHKETLVTHGSRQTDIIEG